VILENIFHNKVIVFAEESIMLFMDSKYTTVGIVPSKHMLNAVV